VRIALCQFNPTVGDFSGNAAKICAGYERGHAAGVELVMFSELAVCGYPPADLLEKQSFVDRAEDTLLELAKLTAVPGAPALLCGSVMRAEEHPGKRVRNVAALLEDGHVSFVQTKKLLPYYDVFDEQRYFEPAAAQSLTFIKGHAVVITICEDAWNDKLFWAQRNYTTDPVEELMAQWSTLPPHISGGRLILNLSASPFWHGKRQLRQRMLEALAKRYRATVVLANQVGANDSLIFDGSSMAVSPEGRCVLEAAAFAEDMLIFDTSDVCAAVQTPAQVPETTRDAASDATADTWNALVLGVRDYVRKCGFHKVLLGLSGGIDSALVAAIAVEALGAENVQGVGMPSEFSSEGSVTDAEALAANLGIRFTQIAVHQIYSQFLKSLEPEFAGTGFGLAEENLQPRIRGSLLMALSNKSGALVLTTGNKSEMACGYCTLYGDMVGALAVIGDVYKTEVYELSKYANRHGEVIPQNTIAKPPSAELRPGQKDTDSLPPYETLDPMLRAYIEQYHSAEEIAAAQKVDVATVREVIGLVERSEYKRQQAAPVLKVSRKSFGMGRRFPIAARTVS
jgi:NAD+ synthase (glutamine-hydrolysing)